MDKLRRALSGDDGRDDDSATGILPVSSFKNYTVLVSMVIFWTGYGFHLFNHKKIGKTGLHGKVFFLISEKSYV